MPHRTQTLEQYLRDAAQNGAIDHTLRVIAVGNVVSAVKFYIHPAGRDGQTVEFVVGANQLMCTSVDGTPVPAIGSTHA